MSHVLLTIFLLAFPLHFALPAPDELEDFLEGAESSIDGVEFEVLDNLRRHSTPSLQPSSVPESKKKKYVQTGLPTHFRAILKRDALIYDLKGEKSYRVGRDIYVLAREKSGDKNVYYLLDSKKNTKYYTDTKNLQSIEVTADLRPEMTQDQHLRGGGRFFGSIDHTKSLVVSNGLSIAREITSAPYTEDTLEIGRGTSDAGATRLDWKAYYLSQLPLNMGIHLGVNRGEIQGTNRSSRAISANWFSVLLGPSVQYTLNSVWDISMSYQKSIFHRLVSGREAYYLSTSSWQLDVTRDFKTSFGTFFVGMGYRLPNSRLKKSNVPSARSYSRRYNESVSMILGYNYNIKLW